MEGKFYRQLGGDCPRTIGHKVEILQSVTSSGNSYLPTGNNELFLVSSQKKAID